MEEKAQKRFEHILSLAAGAKPISSFFSSAAIWTGLSRRYWPVCPGKRKCCSGNTSGCWARRHCGLWKSPVRSFEWVHRKVAGLLQQALNR